MVQVGLLSFSGGSSGMVDLPEDVFACQVRDELLHFVVCHQLAARRSGTVAVKDRSKVSATTAKPHRQKGTGRARQGSLVGPHFRGGGVALGPQGRSFRGKINKKVRALSIKMALSKKFADGALFVSSGKVVDVPKTKSLIMNLEGQLGSFRSVVYCVVDRDSSLRLASRNVHGIRVLSPDSLNVYDMLYCEKVIIDENALQVLVGRLSDAR